MELQVREMEILSNLDTNGAEEVPLLVRCPHFRGMQVGVGKCVLFREVSSTQECPHREVPVFHTAGFPISILSRFHSVVGGSDFVVLDNEQVGPLDRANRIRCMRVRLIDDNVCGDDPGRFFDIVLSTHDNHVIPDPYITRVYIYDAVDCSELIHTVRTYVSIFYLPLFIALYLSLSVCVSMSVLVRVGLVVTTTTVVEDEREATVCANVFSPPVLERDVTVSLNTLPVSAGLTLSLVTYSYSRREKNVSKIVCGSTVQRSSNYETAKWKRLHQLTVCLFQCASICASICARVPLPLSLIVLRYNICMC